MSQLEPAGLWRGKPRYTCPHCPFDTLSEARMREHLTMAHPAKRERPPLVNENDAARTLAPTKPPKPTLVNENEAAASPAATPETEDAPDGTRQHHGRRGRQKRG